MNFYIADLHFGHKNVIAFDNRPFANVEEMDQCLIANWNKVVGENDHVYILGDFCYRSMHSPAWYLQQLKGKKHLIQGNHDSATLNDSKAVELLESIDKMLFVKDGKVRLVLCHFPIAEWNGFYKGAYHLYGHIHKSDGVVTSYMNHLPRAFNVGCMLYDYQPVSFQTLLERNHPISPSV